MVSRRQQIEKLVHANANPSLRSACVPDYLLAGYPSNHSPASTRGPALAKLQKIRRSAGPSCRRGGLPAWHRFVGSPGVLGRSTGSLPDGYAFLSKPFDMDTLINALENLVEASSGCEDNSTKDGPSLKSA